MKISYDFDIPTRDGTKLRADIYRPEGILEDLPVILAYTPYGKHHCYKNHMFPAQDGMACGPNGNSYVFEGVDPVWWTSQGYIVALVDSRGSFASEGDKFFYREVDSYDIYDTVEYLAAIHDCNGVVGMAGSTAVAMYQWMGAVLNPPHLKAFIPNDGMADVFRDLYSHGGVPETLLSSGYRHTFGYGNGTNMVEVPPNHESATLPSSSDFWNAIQPFKNRLHEIMVPVYVISGFSNSGLHTRDSIRAYLDVASQHKYLELHGIYSLSDLKRSQRH